MLAVLGAAVVHALWNALLKSKGDPLAASTGLSLTWVGLGLPAVLVVSPPAPESWPWLAGSIAAHLVYFSAMIGAYRRAPLSFVYPIMRGLPPLGVAIASAVVLGEVPGAYGALGLGLVVSGVAVLGAGPVPPLSVLALVGAAAGSILAYTLLDGVGARLSGTTPGYLAWLTLLQGAAFATGALALGRGALGREVAVRWRAGIVSGILSAGGYLVALWAMTRAPIAPVAALRETSVVFAALFGAFALREPLGARRIAAAALVALGVICVRLGAG